MRHQFPFRSYTTSGRWLQVARKFRRWSLEACRHSLPARLLKVDPAVLGDEVLSDPHSFTAFQHLTLFFFSACLTTLLFLIFLRHLSQYSKDRSAMEASDLIPLLERLEDNVDDLEEVLQPLLEQSLTDTSKKLPLLDKAKLHVLLTYMLESLIFCMS